MLVYDCTRFYKIGKRSRTEWNDEDAIGRIAIVTGDGYREVSTLLRNACERPGITVNDDRQGESDEEENSHDHGSITTTNKKLAYPCASEFGPGRVMLTSIYPPVKQMYCSSAAPHCGTAAHGSASVTFFVVTCFGSLLQVVRSDIPDVDGLPVGVVPRVEGAVLDLEFVGADELVGLAVEAGAGFGGGG